VVVVEPLVVLVVELVVEPLVVVVEPLVVVVEPLVVLVVVLVVGSLVVLVVELVVEPLVVVVEPLVVLVVELVVGSLVVLVVGDIPLAVSPTKVVSPTSNATPNTAPAAAKLTGSRHRLPPTHFFRPDDWDNAWSEGCRACSADDPRSVKGPLDVKGPVGPLVSASLDG